MWEEILKAIPIFLLTTLKVVFGPTLGYAAGLNIITTIFVTVAGMMTSVVAFTYFGDWLRTKLLNRFFKQKKFSPSTRKRVTLWKKYGLTGVAILTPLLLTPIGGTVLAVSFGGSKEKIILYMFISASVFAVGFSILIYEFGDAIMPVIEKYVG
jgi:membrane protein DedA with SNARE-associated domain